MKAAPFLKGNDYRRGAGIAPQVLASVIRVSTHPRIYAQPSTLDEATTFCCISLAPDTCTVVHPGDRYWDIFVDVCAEFLTTGNLIQDSWFPALATESGCERVTIVTTLRLPTPYSELGGESLTERISTAVAAVQMWKV